MSIWVIVDNESGVCINLDKTKKISKGSYMSRCGPNSDQLCYCLSFDNIRVNFLDGEMDRDTAFIQITDIILKQEGIVTLPDYVEYSIK